jgi:hypothetical protein
MLQYGTFLLPTLKSVHFIKILYGLSIIITIY